LMEEQAEDDNDDNDDEHALSTSPTSTIATHLSRSPSTRPKRPSQTPSQTRRRTSSSSSINLATSPNTRTRRLSATSLASAAMGIEDDGRVKGIKSKVVGRGGWVKGMMGFGKETGRGVWGSSGREEWSKVSFPLWKLILPVKGVSRRLTGDGHSGGSSRSVCRTPMGRSSLRTRRRPTSDNIRMASPSRARMVTPNPKPANNVNLDIRRPLVLLHRHPRL
jgi:hypothetical protein